MGQQLIVAIMSLLLLVVPVSVPVSFPLPVVCRGRMETRAVPVGNGEDCELCGGEKSPVLHRNGGKKVET